MASFFQYLQPKGFTALPPQDTTIRLQTVVIKKKKAVTPIESRTASPVPKNQRVSNKNKVRNGHASSSGSKSKSPAPPSVKASNKRRRTTPATQRLTSSGDDDNGDDGSSLKEVSRKRSKISDAGTTTTGNINRRLHSDLAFGEWGNREFAFVHAADIAGLDQSTKYLPAFDASTEDLKLLLRYPGATLGERYVVFLSCANYIYRDL